MRFRTQGHEFRVDNFLKYYVDDVVQSLSSTNYWPDSLNPKIIAAKPGDTVTITDTVTNAVITFSQASTSNPYALTVEVPLTPFFYGHNVMCGVFGSIDDNCFNDIAAANGTVYQTANCTFPILYINATVASYADTWVTNSTVDNCIEGSVIGNITNNCVSKLLKEFLLSKILQIKLVTDFRTFPLPKNNVVLFDKQSMD